MATTDTDVSQLVINKLTKTQYDGITTPSDTELYFVDDGKTYATTDMLATVATSGSYTDLTNKPTIPTATSDLNNDSGFLTTSTLPVATTNSLGVVQVGSGLAVSSGGVLSATGGGVADSVAWGHVTGTLADQTDLNTALGNKVDSSSLATVATSGSYNDLSNKPTIPTVNNATLTIQKNSTTVDTFTANASQDKTINITVPVTAADVSALPASTKYGASFTASINTTTYVMTLTLKDQDGNTLGTAQTIDLPLESVVVNGSYDSTNKKIVLTLQSGSTIDIPVGDLVSGLQTEITSSSMLDADLVDDSTSTHKFTTASDISKLAGIAAGAEVNVQSDWNQTTATADDYIKNKPSLATVATSGAYSDLSGTPSLATVATSGSYNDLSNKPTIPTVNNGTLTIQKNGTNVATFTANQSSGSTANITVPTAVSELNNDSGYQTAAQVQTAVDGKQDELTAGDHIDITNDVISAVDYVHSENPVSTTAVTPIVTGSMISNGTITADKLATGATIQLTLSTTDIGEGAALAANTLYGVYQ